METSVNIHTDILHIYYIHVNVYKYIRMYVQIYGRMYVNINMHNMWPRMRKRVLWKPHATSTFTFVFQFTLCDFYWYWDSGIANTSQNRDFACFDYRWLTRPLRLSKVLWSTSLYCKHSFYHREQFLFQQRKGSYSSYELN